MLKLSRMSKGSIVKKNLTMLLGFDVSESRSYYLSKSSRDRMWVGVGCNTLTDSPNGRVLNIVA